MIVHRQDDCYLQQLQQVFSIYCLQFLQLCAKQHIFLCAKTQVGAKTAFIRWQQTCFYRLKTKKHKNGL